MSAASEVFILSISLTYSRHRARGTSSEIHLKIPRILHKYELFVFSGIHSPHGSLARMRSDSGPGGPAPTRFSATMRNWYSFPSTSSPIVVLLSTIGSRVMRIQRGARPDAALLLSTWYPMIGVPPSFSGGPHDKTHESL